jgi:hypothetical protein
MRIFALILAAAAWALAAGPLVSAEELFKWGEYDSLIRVLEPLAAAPGYLSRAADRADSADRARCLLYLGVAYFAKGRSDRADSAFVSACALDSALQLDRFYVTPAIAEHFRDVRTEAFRRREERTARAPSPGAPEGAQAPLPSGDRPAARLKDDRAWLWWGLGAAALVAAGGGAYWIATQPSAPREQVTTLDIRDRK